MTTMYPAARDAAMAETAVFHSELNPVDFLDRAACMYPDRVATLLVNSAATLEAHFGVPAAGGVLVAVNHRLAGAEVGYILAHSGARFLLLDAGLEALAGPAARAGVTVIRCAGSGGPADPYEQFLAGGSPVRPASWLEDEGETIPVNYTWRSRPGHRRLRTAA